SWRSNGGERMNIPVQITFKNFDSSTAVETAIRERAEQLEKYFDRITSCRVVVEAPHQNHLKGNLFHVRIDLTVPGDELVVNRNHEKNHAHEDVYVAIRDAFDAMKNQLRSYVDRKRGNTH